MPTKNFCCSLNGFCLLLFEGTFTSFFNDKKSSRSRKTVEVNVFYYSCLMRRIRICLWLTDPRGPKTFGSGTLVFCRMSSKQTKRISVRTKTRSDSVVFQFVSWNQKEKISVCFGVSNLYRNNWNKQNRFETTLKFMKNTKICSLSNCFGWSSVCFGSIETSKLCFGIEAKQPETNCFGNNPKFSEKIPKYALYQTVSVALLFV
jgi:hypothetical protein